MLLFVNYCIIFQTNNCKPTFAPPCTFTGYEITLSWFNFDISKQNTLLTLLSSVSISWMFIVETKSCQERSTTAHPRDSLYFKCNSACGSKRPLRKLGVFLCWDFSCNFIRSVCKVWIECSEHSDWSECPSSDFLRLSGLPGITPLVSLLLENLLKCTCCRPIL